MSIIGKRSGNFVKLFEMLRALEADRGDLTLLGDFNGTLIKTIMVTERDILKTKAKVRLQTTALKTSRPTKERAIVIRRRIRVLEVRLEGLSRQLWLWRLFGDSVAHLFLDKFAIKHTVFDTESYDIKSGAGMMTGKSGLGGEVGLLLEALKANVPAILCDCTNVLRYGDVCLLGDSDPYLIEVKSSTRLNQRGKRQAAKLERLQDFLKTDTATGFRGNPGEVRRVTVELPEWGHADRLNRCIAEAKENGYAIHFPEPGLIYFAIYESSTSFDFGGMDMSEGLTVYSDWNEAKNIPDWSYYVPFLLTIRRLDHLLDFVEGRVIIHVYLNTDVLVRHCSAPGWKAVFLDEGDYSVACQHVATQGVMGLSRQMLYRIFYDCTSVEWMGRSQVAAMERAWEEGAERYGPHLIVDQREHVEGALGVPYDDLMARFAAIDGG